MTRLLLALLAGLAAAAPVHEVEPTAGRVPNVLITGATGRLGSLLYGQARASADIGSVRAFVTNVTKAKAYLNCSKCDASEGIFVGDVTDKASLAAAMAGVDAVLVAVGASPGDSADKQRAVEFGGVENTVAALYGAPGATAPASRQVVLCSSMGTTAPDPSPQEGGSILFWKLNAEAALLSASLKGVVVKPCGLDMGDGGKKALAVGRDDALLDELKVPVMPRADVARVMLRTVARGDAKLRFDLCAKMVGAPTTDLDALIDAAAYP